VPNWLKALSFLKKVAAKNKERESHF
jgi:hypothetical protein